MSELQRPSAPGPYVRIIGPGVDVVIIVNDELDWQIASMAVQLCEKRRSARADNEV